jgi:hypothetical protein
MKPVIMAGAAIVNLALISYAIGVIAQQRSHKVGGWVTGFLTLGVLLDITATICMMLGTANSPFTVHGLIGYSALALMIIATVRAWVHRTKMPGAPVPRGLHLFIRYSFIWWVITWGTGIAMAINRRL